VTASSTGVNKFKSLFCFSFCASTTNALVILSTRLEDGGAIIPQFFDALSANGVNDCYQSGVISNKLDVGQRSVRSSLAWGSVKLLWIPMPTQLLFVCRPISTGILQDTIGGVLTFTVLTSTIR